MTKGSSLQIVEHEKKLTISLDQTDKLKNISLDVIEEVSCEVALYKMKNAICGLHVDRFWKNYLIGEEASVSASQCLV